MSSFNNLKSLVWLLVVSASLASCKTSLLALQTAAKTQAASAGIVSAETFVEEELISDITLVGQTPTTPSLNPIVVVEEDPAQASKSPTINPLILVGVDDGQGTLETR